MNDKKGSNAKKLAVREEAMRMAVTRLKNRVEYAKVSSEYYKEDMWAMEDAISMLETSLKGTPAYLAPTRRRS